VEYVCTMSDIRCCSRMRQGEGRECGAKAEAETRAEARLPSTHPAPPTASLHALCYFRRSSTALRVFFRQADSHFPSLLSLPLFSAVILFLRSPAAASTRAAAMNAAEPRMRVDAQEDPAAIYCSMSSAVAHVFVEIYCPPPRLLCHPSRYTPYERRPSPAAL